MPSSSAVNCLMLEGMDDPVANELLALWCADEWDRSERAKATRPNDGQVAYVVYQGHRLKITVEEA